MTTTPVPDDSSSVTSDALLAIGLHQLCGGILSERRARLQEDPLFVTMQREFAKNSPDRAIESLAGRIRELAQIVAMSSEASATPLTQVQVERGMQVLLGRNRDIRREEEAARLMDCAPRARRRVWVEFSQLASAGEGSKS